MFSSIVFFFDLSFDLWLFRFDIFLLFIKGTDVDLYFFNGSILPQSESEFQQLL